MNANTYPGRLFSCFFTIKKKDKYILRANPNTLDPLWNSYVNLSDDN